jgi:hypothetical protein
VQWEALFSHQFGDPSKLPLIFYLQLLQKFHVHSVLGDLSLNPTFPLDQVILDISCPMNASFSSEPGPSTTTVLAADMFSDVTFAGNDVDAEALMEQAWAKVSRT